MSTESMTGLYREFGEATVDKRKAVALIICERAIGVTWDMLATDRADARRRLRSGTDITDYGVHQDELLDAADAVLAYLEGM